MRAFKVVQLRAAARQRVIDCVTVESRMSCSSSLAVSATTTIFVARKIVYAFVVTNTVIVARKIVVEWVIAATVNDTILTTISVVLL